VNPWADRTARAVAVGTLVGLGLYVGLPSSMAAVLGFAAGVLALMAEEEA